MRKKYITADISKHSQKFQHIQRLNYVKNQAQCKFQNVASFSKWRNKNIVNTMNEEDYRED